ncbi:Relaxin receptor 1, partial [Fragariocoptes setiger]
MCLVQHLNCDGFPDCDSGEDEKNCVDMVGQLLDFYVSWADWNEKHNHSIANTSNSSLSSPMLPRRCPKDLFDQDRCPCDLSDPLIVICENHNLTQMPLELSKNITKLRLSMNQITSIDYLSSPESLESLYLFSNRISYIKPFVFQSAVRLSKLDLSYNELVSIERDAFVGLKNLTTLISRVAFRTFSNLTSLSWLTLNNNQITDIEWDAFSGDSQLRELDLSHNRISKLERNMFRSAPSLTVKRGFLRLTKLKLGHNPIRSLDTDVFSDLPTLGSLDLSEVVIDNIDERHFAHLKQLHFIYFIKFRYCHFASHVRVCRPLTDGLSSAQHLLVFPVLRFAVWIVALVCCIGNIVVLIWRHVSRREDRIVSVFIKNLSVADLMMGVYLLAIGWHDVEFRDQYKWRAVAWMSSWPCTAIGFLAMLSSELSVLILALITVERYRSIRSNYYSGETVSRAKLNIVFVWLVSLVIALYPIVHWSTTGDNVYYASNGLCLPLHIDQPFTSGWQYSAFIFLGINFSAVVLIICLYIRMYVIIRHDRRYARPVLIGKEREDAILAARFFFIVLTDCMCWIPIVVIKVIALTSALTNVEISSSVYAWLAVFIIPINSALNPIIYTLAAPTELRDAICRLADRIEMRFDQLLSRGSHATIATSSSGADDSTRHCRGRKSTSVSTATCESLSSLHHNNLSLGDPRLIFHDKGSVTHAIVHVEHAKPDTQVDSSPRENNKATHCELIETENKADNNVIIKNNGIATQYLQSTNEQHLDEKHHRMSQQSDYSSTCLIHCCPTVNNHHHTDQPNNV